MAYTYPATDYDQPQVLLATLGSFWAEVYSGVLQLDAVLQAKSSIERQTAQDLLEAADVLARRTVPIYHTDNWYLLRLYKSQTNSREVTLPTFDGQRYYNDGAAFDGVLPQDTFTYPLPSELVEIPLLLNRFAGPTLVWHPGQDFLLTPGRLTLLTDPFTDVRVAKRPVYQDGEIIDEEAGLWVFRGKFDWEQLYRQYGYIIGLQLRSSQGYRDLLNAFFDAIVGGTTRRQIERAFSAMTGIPLVRETQEVVEAITLDRRHRLVITDQHVYRFHPAANPVVAVGDTVTAGQSLTDALEFIEFNRGQVPDTLRALTMGSGFLATCYYGELVFENKDVPLEVTEAADHPSGFTFVKFGLGGFPADIERFFEEVHARGIAVSQLPTDNCSDDQLITIPGNECDDLPTQQIRVGTLAHLLDTRTVKKGEPTAAVLPKVINPLKFLVANVLRNNAAVVRVKANNLGSQAAGLHLWTLSRKIMPPHTALIVLIELDMPSEQVSAGQLTEDLNLFTGMATLADTITSDTITEHLPGIRIVAGSCQ